MWQVNRIALFLLKLALVVPLLFWIWGMVQPSYSGLVTSLADLALGIEEWGGRVTHLRLGASGDVIHVLSLLREDGLPATDYDARTLHFYLVPSLAVVLSFPGLGWLTRLRTFAIALGLVILFQTIALLVTVEHTYAVTLAEVARRHYSPAEQAAYSWLMEAFDFIAVQGVPAAVVIFLVAWHGPLGTGNAPGKRAGIEDARAGTEVPSVGPDSGAPSLEEAAGLDPSGSPSQGLRAGIGEDRSVPEEEKVEAAPAQRDAPTIHASGVTAGNGRRFSGKLAKVGALAAFALAAAALAFGGWAHRANVRGRQSDRLWTDGFRALTAGDRAGAEPLFLRSVELNPASAYGLAGLGHVYLQRGDAPNAARVLAEAIRLDPAQYSWHLHYADAMWLLGRRAEAEKILMDAIAVWPGERALRMRACQWLTTQNRLCEAVPHLEAFLSMAAADQDAAVARSYLNAALAQCPAATRARP